MSIKFFKVGGAVRDELLGLPSKDIDYAVEAPSWDAMRQEILDRGGKIFVETPKYFTIRAHMPKLGNADFVLCRKDGTYKDGRHPETVEVGTIYDDLARRDFTMNAIAVDCDTGEILDPHDGRRDISDSLIRFVGIPKQRLEEDKLRAFRAVRFALTKYFSIEEVTRCALQCLDVQDFANISTERIRDELLKMFSKNTHVAAWMLFIDYPVLMKVALQRGIWLKPTTEQR